MCCACLNCIRIFLKHTFITIFKIVCIQKHLNDKIIDKKNISCLVFSTNWMTIYLIDFSVFQFHKKTWNQSDIEKRLMPILNNVCLYYWLIYYYDFSELVKQDLLYTFKRTFEKNFQRQSSNIYHLILSYTMKGWLKFFFKHGRFNLKMKFALLERLKWLVLELYCWRFTLKESYLLQCRLFL